MAKFQLTCIEWDTDGEPETDLPESLLVDVQDIEDAIDEASDRIGYCIKSARVHPYFQLIQGGG